MAVKPATVVVDNDGVVIVTWTDLDDGDTGQPVRLARYADKTVQLTSGAPTGIAMQGSNDGTEYSQLTATDASDVILVPTTYEIATIVENPLYMRPSATGGTDSVVVLVAKVIGK